MSRLLLSLVGLTIALVFFVSCTKEETAPQKQQTHQQTQQQPPAQQQTIQQGGEEGAPMIVKYDPKTTKAGQDFNIHNGQSVVWMEVKNIKNNIVVVWDGKQLPADINAERTVISFVVPKDLYANPGSYQVYLLDPETGLKSLSVYFIVS